MFHSCWWTSLVRLKWYFWEWFTGPAEKYGDKPFHWDLLTLGSNAGGSLFQYRMDFFPFLSDKWSAYVRWEIEKNEKPAGIRGSIWKLHMQRTQGKSGVSVLALLTCDGSPGWGLASVEMLLNKSSSLQPRVWVWKHWASCAACKGLLIPNSFYPSLGNKLFPHVHGRNPLSFELLSCVHFVHNK